MQVKYIDHYLNDNMVAHIARHSFDKFDAKFSDEDNENLIKYLARGIPAKEYEELLIKMKNCESIEELKELAFYLRSVPTHWAPFGHPHITLKVSAPVPIRTQCFKHKIGFVESEESRRYITSTPELFIPDSFRESAKNKKQGSAGAHKHSDKIVNEYKATCVNAIEEYELAIASLVCPEQARLLLPQGVEVNWVWTGSLYSYANFYNQRSDSHAQKEVQDLAEMVANIIEPLYPISWKALTKGDY